MTHVLYYSHLQFNLLLVYFEKKKVYLHALNSTCWNIYECSDQLAILH